MKLVELDKKGQVTIPRATLRAAGIEGEQMLIVEATADGAILLRPSGKDLPELYSDERIAEFLAEDEMPGDMRARVGDATSRNG